ncbi:MAG TPA: cytochrome P450, partial [Chloroflexota bacterium]
PGPTGLALVRTLAAYAADPFSTLTQLARDFGDVVRFIQGPVNAFLINRPEYIERVLVTDDWNFAPMRPFTVNRAMRQGLFTSQGHFHAHQRHLLAPAYGPDHVDRFGETITSVGARYSESWPDGGVVDIEREMVRLSVFVAADLLFGADARLHAQELVAPALPVNVYLGTRSTNPLSAVREVLPALPSNREFWRAMRRLDAALLALIRERRMQPAANGDLLSTLLQVRDPRDGSGLSDAQVRDEVLSMYTTGNAVLASALLWTWYLLAEHGDVEAKLQAEVEAVLGGRAPSFGDLPGLSYTAMVVAESMRLFPPAWTIGRRTIQDYAIDGITLPSGSLVVLSPFVTQRDARFHPAPLVVDPQRWTPEARASRPPFSYFPFSGGPRSCLGEHLALTELVLLVATLAQRGRLHLVPDQPLGFRPLIALRPKGGMRMRWQRHRSAVSPVTPPADR